MFSIETSSGKLISGHSYFQQEDEIILPPGRYLKVVDKSSPAQDLYIIHLREIAPPHPMLADPFDLGELKKALPQPKALPTLLISNKKQDSYEEASVISKPLPPPPPPPPLISNKKQDNYEEASVISKPLPPPPPPPPLISNKKQDNYEEASVISKPLPPSSSSYQKQDNYAASTAVCKPSVPLFSEEGKFTMPYRYMKTFFTKTIYEGHLMFLSIRLGSASISFDSTPRLLFTVWSHHMIEGDIFYSTLTDRISFILTISRLSYVTSKKINIFSSID
jgi:hypothetical protein